MAFPCFGGRGKTKSTSTRGEDKKMYYYKKPKDFIFEYLIFKNKKKGILLSYTKDGKVHVGYSLCHKDDIFDIDKGIAIAMERAKLDSNKTQIKFTAKKIVYYDQETAVFPKSIKKNLLRFLDRCFNYYVDKDFPMWVKGLYLLENGVDLSNIDKEIHEFLQKYQCNASEEYQIYVYLNRRDISKEKYPLFVRRLEIVFTEGHNVMKLRTDFLIDFFTLARNADILLSGMKRKEWVIAWR